jgi:hypothetical protein
MKISLVAIAVLIFNVPFGYWRANIKKFSLQWFLAIHLPIPFIVFLRIYSDIGFAFYTYPILVAAFYFGQLLGTKIYARRRSIHSTPLTSCLVMDIYKHQ